MLGLVTTIVLLTIVGAILGAVTQSILVASFIVACLVIAATGGGFLKLNTEGSIPDRVLGGIFWLTIFVGPVALGSWLVVSII